MTAKAIYDNELVTRGLERLYDPECRSCAVIADATHNDYPIIFATPEFIRVTGYDRNFIIGNNCRFLQGKDTNKEMIAEVRCALRNAKPIRTEILNYRKDGRELINFMRVEPIFDTMDQLKFFVGYQNFTLIE